MPVKTVIMTTLPRIQYYMFIIHLSCLQCGQTRHYFNFLLFVRTAILEGDSACLGDFPEPCLSQAIWCWCKPFSQSQGSFHKKAALSLAKSLVVASSCSRFPDSKVHGANMGPTWVLSAPVGPHVGPMNLAIRVRRTPWSLGASYIDDLNLGPFLSMAEQGLSQWEKVLHMLSILSKSTRPSA